MLTAGEEQEDGSSTTDQVAVQWAWHVKMMFWIRSDPDLIGRIRSGIWIRSCTHIKIFKIFPNTQMFKFVTTNEDQGVKSYGTVQSSDKVSCCLPFLISSVMSRGPAGIRFNAPDSDADPDPVSKKSA